MELVCPSQNVPNVWAGVNVVTKCGEVLWRAEKLLACIEDFWCVASANERLALVNIHKQSKRGGAVPVSLWTTPAPGPAVVVWRLITGRTWQTECPPSPTCSLGTTWTCGRGDKLFATPAQCPPIKDKRPVLSPVHRAVFTHGPKGPGPGRQISWGGILKKNGDWSMVWGLRKKRLSTREI
jgi:hypothetical protein